VTQLVVVSINGALVAGDRAGLSPFDHGLMVGDGVFETMKVVDGVPFALSRHLDRLRRSAAALALEVPVDAELRASADAVIAANGPDVGRLRITITGGPGPLGSGRGDGAHTVVMVTGPVADWPAAADVVVVPWSRNERGAIAGVKTISYAENVVALAWAAERDAAEAIFGNTKSRLCEGTGSNVFVGVDGHLVTPPLDAGCLAGITRELLLEQGVAVEEDLPLEALAAADEAFLASSTREVQPIARVDGRPLPSCPGPLTTAAEVAFATLMAKSLDP
jgi:branched-chain amino acid aminotransferase